jgi:1,4-dihydroxy-2-naphthoate octaprenyltransferase
VQSVISNVSQRTVRNIFMKLITIIKTLRPSFLVLTTVCVFLGVSTSLTVQPQVNLAMVLLVLLGAITAHISVNTLNEYHDFKSGLDFKTKKTPFSGGSGALPDNPNLAGLVLGIGIASLLITVTIGIYIIMERGFTIVPVGLAGLIVIITYTQFLTRKPLLGLVASGTGFGILMVVGTHVVLTGSYSQLAWLVSLVPFFLVNNLLLLNQYPDTEADASVGRNTFPIAFGYNKSSCVYAFFMIVAYSLILILIVNKDIPSLSTIALIPLVFALFALRGAFKFSSNIGEEPHYLGANVAAAILTPLLLGFAIING